MLGFNRTLGWLHNGPRSNPEREEAPQSKSKMATSKTWKKKRDYSSRNEDQGVFKYHILQRKGYVAVLQFFTVLKGLIVLYTESNIRPFSNVEEIQIQPWNPFIQNSRIFDIFREQRSAVFAATTCSLFLYHERWNVQLIRNAHKWGTIFFGNPCSSLFEISQLENVLQLSLG